MAVGCWCSSDKVLTGLPCVCVCVCVHGGARVCVHVSACKWARAEPAEILGKQATSDVKVTLTLIDELFPHPSFHYSETTGAQDYADRK